MTDVEIAYYFHLAVFSILAIGSVAIGFIFISFDFTLKEIGKLAPPGYWDKRDGDNHAK